MQRAVAIEAAFKSMTVRRHKRAMTAWESVGERPLKLASISERNRRWASGQTIFVFVTADQGHLLMVKPHCETGLQHVAISVYQRAIATAPILIEPSQVLSLRVDFYPSPGTQAT